MAAVAGGSAGGQGAGGIRAGLAYVELIAKDKIGPVLDKLQKKLAGVGSALTKGGAAGLGAGAAILAPIVALATAGADRFDRMANEAKKLDLPIDQFYKLSTAAEIAGVSIEDIANDPSKFADALGMVGEAPVEAIKAAQQASMEWRATLIALKEASAGLLTDLMPLMKVVTGFVRENKGAVKAAAILGAALAALGIGAIALGAAFNVTAIAAGVLKGAMLFLVSTPGLIVAAIAGVVVAFFTLTDTGRKMAADLGAFFADIGATFEETWGGIVAAIGKGDIEGAMRVAGAGLKVAWLQIMESLTSAWEGFKGAVLSGWASMGNVFEEAVAGWQAMYIHATQGKAAAIDFVRGVDSNLQEMRRHETRERERAAAANIRQAQGELAAARQALNQAVAVARAAPAGGRLIGDPGMPVTAAMMARVRGAFSGPLGQQLGAGSQFQRDLLRGIKRDADANEASKKVLDGIAENLARVLQFQ